MLNFSSYTSSWRAAAALSLGLGLGLLAAPYAQTNTPKYSNEFLNLGAGARSLGMGKVQVSLTNDATAGYWNPAALANQTTKYDGVLMHSELFSGVVKNEYAAFSMPLDDKSVVAATLLRSGVDNIADTRLLINQYDGSIDYSRITYFSVADYALLLSYARKLGPEGLSVGANAKLIYRNIGSYANGYGFGIDAGVQYNHKNWRLGLMARDITTTFNAWSIDTDKFKASAAVGDRIPVNSTEITLPRLVLGIGYQFKLPAQFTALVATDLETTTDGERNTLVHSRTVSIDPRVGIEIGYRNLVFLRGGAGNYQQITNFDKQQEWKGQYSLGAGVAFSGLRIDLALSRLALDQSSNVNSLIVSLGYAFGGRVGVPTGMR
jgi:hypothetical protein